MGGGEGRERLKDGNVVVDLGTVPLGNALCDPDNVPALLLLELDVGVENAKVELVQESQLVQLHLQREEKECHFYVSYVTATSRL